MNIDAHQHFWQYDPISDAWINDDMKEIHIGFGTKRQIRNNLRFALLYHMQLNVV
ncbi:MAG: putative TIM-barrel fold metal-dependent hydrolase [Cyclobacteriaceae bacterium]|jgi:predicted TIM-barrel fold metal-dependent hydrolase